MTRKRKPLVRTGNGAPPGRAGRGVPQLPRRAVVASAAALLALFAGLTLWEMAGDSVTSDERIHLPVGVAYWKDHEFRLNPEHPPLIKLLAAAPLLAMNLQMPSTEPEESGDYNSHQQLFGTKFLFSQDADRILFWCRLPVVALGILLGLVIFQWSSRLFGHPGAGLLSLALFALEPSLLAHSHYVTTDVGLACFGSMSMYFLWRFAREGLSRHLVLATLALGLALASKFSAVFLVPVFLVLLALCYPDNAFEGTRYSRIGRWAACGLCAAGAAVVVQASYLFSTDLMLYWKGFRTVNLNHVPEFVAYAAGRFYPDGVWWYPLYAILVKVPIPTLGLIGLGLYWSFRHRGADFKTQDLAFVLLPAVVLTLATCGFAGNIGVRYMIPVLALLLVAAGGAFFPLVGSRAGRLAGGVLALWLLASVGRTAPHFISYFNETIGGPANGPYSLDDSNIDWGQDLKRLTAYARDRGVTDVLLSFWGPAIPEYYGDREGIRFLPWSQEAARSASPPPGLYAISVNNLIRIRRAIAMGNDPALDWLGRFKPTDRVGYSIYIYDFRGGRPGVPPS